jgi:hypothetical protein
MKNSNESNTRPFSACSAVPQTTAPPRAHGSKVAYVNRIDEAGNYNQRTNFLPDFQLKVVKTAATGKLMLKLNV